MRLKSFFLLLFLIPFVATAQKDDLELWSSLKFSKDISKKIRFELEEQIRWADSLSQYKKNFTDLGIKYELHKRHSLALNVRLVDELDKEKFMRMQFDLNSGVSFKKIPFVLKQRLRYQHVWDEFGEFDKSLVRAKWACQWKAYDLKPYFAHELYWGLQQFGSLSKQRSTLGVQWSMSKEMKIKMFLRKQNEMNKKNPDRLSIIGIGMHYKF
jgi:hypothetical protein